MAKKPDLDAIEHLAELCSREAHTLREWGLGLKRPHDRHMVNHFAEGFTYVAEEIRAALYPADKDRLNGVLKWIPLLAGAIVMPFGVNIASSYAYDQLPRPPVVVKCTNRLVEQYEVAAVVVARLPTTHYVTVGGEVGPSGTVTTVPENHQGSGTAATAFTATATGTAHDARVSTDPAGRPSPQEIPIGSATETDTAGGIESSSGVIRASTDSIQASTSFRAPLVVTGTVEGSQVVEDDPQEAEPPPVPGGRVIQSPPPGRTPRRGRGQTVISRSRPPEEPEHPLEHRN